MKAKVYKVRGQGIVKEDKIYHSFFFSSFRSPGFQKSDNCFAFFLEFSTKSIKLSLIFIDFSRFVIILAVEKVRMPNKIKITPKNRRNLFANDILIKFIF